MARRIPPLPPLPVGGRPGRAKHETSGEEVDFLVIDDVRQTQSYHPKKTLCLQQLQFEDGTIEFRFGYYLYTNGRWGWSRNSPMVPIEDFKSLLAKAKKKGWL